ncbi:MAG: hypothetical protein FJ096_15735 [Deltaproteobacteria bacterium]|nr:hypothetical protein [Deltaproteobacteria bacterium]
MTRSRLVFALHFHQPFGNLDAVLEDACDRCYRPVLEVLGAHPTVQAAIHFSGSLLDWVERRRSRLVDLLGELVRPGQVELLGGGDQEPMLATLPEGDARAQLAAMAARCERLFGSRPRGMWLAERVWEPGLARLLADVGHDYTLLDDTHLLAAGAQEPLGAY